MINRRPYQQAAIDALWHYWMVLKGKNPLVEMATGTGKSVVIAGLVMELLARFPQTRVLMLVHVKELVEQNFKAVLRIWPDAPIGIYSAGLNKRQAHNQIVFASVQSVYDKAHLLGKRNIVLVDEAHLIPPSGMGMYQRLFKDLRQQHDKMQIAGFTATAYRLGRGRIDRGDDRLFEETVYTYGIADGIRDGYLSPLISKATAARIDVSGVKKAGGDFIESQLQKKILASNVTEEALDEMLTFGEHRRSWLSFCSGVEHATMLRDLARDRGIPSEVVTGETPSGERDRIIRAFRSGQLRHLTNANVLTTGFDAPGVDLISMLRPTESAGLYVQIAGRGTRLLGQSYDESVAAGKSDCLVLDFAGNVRRHGPVDQIVVKEKGPGNGEAPVKECPVCKSYVHISVMTCKECGYEFPPSENERHEGTADGSRGILSTELAPPDTRHVLFWNMRLWQKQGRPDSVRISYHCGIGTILEWIGPGQPGMFGKRADRLWRACGGQQPTPLDAGEFLARQKELTPPSEIDVKMNGQYQEIVARRFKEEAA